MSSIGCKKQGVVQMPRINGDHIEVIKIPKLLQPNLTNWPGFKTRKNLIVPLCENHYETAKVK